MSTLTRLIRATRFLLSCAAIVASASTLAQSQPTNASFESPAYGAAGRNALPTTATWTFAGTAGIERFSVNDIGTPNTGGLNGMQAAYLSSTGTVASLGKVSQDINFPAAGQYQLRFMAGRVGAANAIRVSVGGVVVDSDITPRLGGGTTTRQLESWWTVPFSVAAAGNLTVSFSATNTAATLAVGDVMWVDQVTMLALPVALPNGSFETVGSGWTLASGATNTALTTPGVSGARGLVSSGTSGFNYFATSTTVTVPAGVYSLSLRIARTDPNTAACTTALSGTYTGAGTLALIPAPKETELTAYTTSSFSLPAGTYSLRLNGQCGGGAFSPVVYDGLVLNKAGPDFANTDFATPYLGVSGASDTAPPWLPPWQTNPPGATWTFVDNAIGTGYGVGIQGNATSTVTVYPRTEFGGGQFGTVWSSNSGIRQSVSLASGVYVVAVRAAYGSFKLSVNGVNQSTLMHGGILQNQSANGYRFIEVLSEPFTITTSSNVQLGFEGSRFSFQYPRIVRLGDINTNSPPAVSLSLSVNGSSVTGPVTPGGTLLALATASDANGLQRIRVLRNGVALAPESTAVAPANAASPLTVTVSPLTPGSFTYVAEATDHLGAVSTASQALVVNTPPLAQISSPTAGAAVTQVPLVIQATVSDPDAGQTITKAEFYRRVGAVDTKLGEVLNPSGNVSFTVTNPVRAAQQLFVRVFDSVGGQADSALVSIVVSGLLNGNFELPSAACSGSSCLGNTWRFLERSGAVSNAASVVPTGVGTCSLGGGIASLQLAVGTSANTSGRVEQDVYLLPGTYDLKLKARTQNVSRTDTLNVSIGTFSANAFVISPIDFALERTVTPAGGFAVSTAGNYTLRIEASNSTNGSTYVVCVDDVKLSLRNATPTITTFTSTPSGVQQAPATSVSLSATASDPDSSGYVSTIEFLVNGASASPALICTNNTTPPAKPFSCSQTWTGAAAGTNYSLTSRATDNQGGTVTSSAVSVVFNRPPTATFTNPIANAQLAGPNAVVPLRVTTSDPDGDALTKVEFYNGATLIGTATSPVSANVYSINTAALAAGNYTITAKAYDVRGGVTAAPLPNVTFTVKATNALPVVTLATAPAGITTTTFGTAVNFTASATDTDSGIASIAIFDTTAGATLGTCTYAAVTNAGPCTAALSGSAVVGNHTIVARATDSQGVAYGESAPIVISVTASTNTPPKVVSIALPSTGLSALTPATFRVTASDNIALGTNSVAINPLTNTMMGATVVCPGGAIEECTVSWTPSAAGVYTLGLRVTDSEGATSDASTVIAVSEAPNAPTLTLPTTSNIGTTAGQFVVSESGAATYSIPIAVPPGVNGVQPSLALAYNSQGGDGNLGVGWNLSGTSSIARCPKTIATDGVREPINYDNDTDPFTGNDAFCLDGQRLVPVSGGLSQVACPAIAGVTPNGQCKAWEFRTELDSYSRIIGIGDNVDPNVPGSGSGPTRFRVYAKSGQILEYGSRWWGVGAPRPDPLTSLLTNPGFEDTELSDSCWITGSVDPYYYDATGNWVVNPCYGNPTVPQGWAGFTVSSPLGYFKTPSTGASSSGWAFSVGSGGNSGVQRNGSAWSQTGPYAPQGTQTAFLQKTGSMSTTAFLEAGKYTLGVRLAGRPAGSGYGGDQTVQVKLNGVLITSFSTTSGQPFTLSTALVTVPYTGTHTLSFVGTRTDDQTALLDDITFVPINGDIYSLKVFPLDRVEDRNGNYMHIDYGGTHEDQVLVYPDGSTRTVSGTLVSSYGNATLPEALPTSTNAAPLARIALIAQGARPALEMYPRRFTYGMRSATPGNGNNQSSVSGVEISRVILNYVCVDGTTPATNGSCLSASGVIKGYDTGSGQMLRSKRLSSIFSLVGGSDDTSLASDRNNFHWNEMTIGQYAYGAQCLTGAESSCGTLVRKYTLGYEQSTSTQRMRLNSVTECSGDGFCLPSTSFAWQNSTLELNASGSGSQVANDGANWNFLLDQGRVADVVGDGRSRIVRRGSDPGNVLVVCGHNGTKFICDADTGATSKWLLPVNPASGFRYEIPNGGVNRSWFMADLNGDGVADLVAITSPTTAYGCLSTGAGFGACANVPPAANGGTRHYTQTGDFDGDGRIDIAFYRGNGQFEICRASGGIPSSPSLAWTCNAPTGISGLPIGFQWATDELDHLMIADFNGDGRADIAYRVANVCAVGGANVIPPMPGQQCKDVQGNSIQPTTSDTYWSVCFAGGPANAITFTCATRSGAQLTGAVKAVSGKPSLLATYDFNGDGLADMATYDAAGQGWRVCLSTGDGEFADRDANGDCKVWRGPLGTAQKTVAGDFNGDGRTDLTYFDTTVGSWRLCVSKGDGFVLDANLLCPAYASLAASPAITSSGQAEAFLGDFNGDGKTDLAVNGLNTSGTLSYGFTNATMPDLLTTVTTGLGAQTKVNYLPLTNSTVYTKTPPDITATNDNEINIQSPMYVVRSTCASTGSGTSDWFKSEYFYGGLRADKWGRGLYGFFSRSITDNLKADSNCTTTDPAQRQITASRNSHAWPNVGRPLEVAKAVFAGTTSILISSSEAVYGSRSRLSGIARPASVGGQYTIWEGFQTLSIQNPRFGRAGTDATGFVRDLDPGSVARFPTTVTYTGIEPAANVALDPKTGTVNIGGFYDSYGNPLKVTTRTLHPSSSEVWEQAVTNTYFYAANGGADTTRWLLGKLDSATTTSSVSGYTTNGSTSVTRKSSFTYQGINGASCTGAVAGQLCTETVEPDFEASTGVDKTLFQRSAYEYDNFGNRAKSTATFYDTAGTLNTRSSGTTYSVGKYVIVNTRYYTGDASKNLSDTREYTDLRCRMATKVTDANNNYATTEYDGFCRKVRESAFTNDGKLAKQTTYALGTAGIIAGAENYALTTTSSDGGQSIAYYDNLQRAVRGQAKAFDGTFSESTTKFDAWGRQWQVIKPASNGSVNGTATTTVTYDVMGRAKQESVAYSGTGATDTVTTTYAGLTTTVERTNTGGTPGATNAGATHSTAKVANAKGLVATVTTSPIATTVSYQYDALGNLTKVTSPNNVEKTMQYDRRGRQTQLVDPDAGTYSYQYNGAGEQTRQSDSRTPVNFVTTTTYDPFGRKVTRGETQASGTNAVAYWFYDCANAKGLLCSVQYSNGSGDPTKTTTYDKYSRPTATTTYIAGAEFVSQIAYDALGRPKYAVYPQATGAAAPLSVKTSYNSAGYAYQVEHATTGFIYQTITARNSDGQLKTATLGGGYLAQSNAYSTDGLARIASINITGGTTLAQTFGFDNIGNLTSRSLVGGGRNETEAFTYDALDRLTGNTGNGLVISPADTGSYAFDSAGNLTSKAGLAMGYTANSNRLCNIGASTGCAAGTTNNVLYDGNGNITQYTRPNSGTIPGADGATLTLAGYTAFNLPTQISKAIAGSTTASAQFYYDAGYQRVRQMKWAGPIGTTAAFTDDILYVVPGGFEVHRNVGGKVVSSIATISGPDGVIATVTTNYDPATGQVVTQANATNLSGTNTVTKLLLKDHLGSMIAEFTVTAGSGTAATAGTLSVHGFGPWGNARAGLNGDQRGFTGHEHLAELGIIHMNGRLYDAVIGRFLQADPIIQAPQNAQSHNRYSYVLNNPLSFTDPSGFSWWTTWRRPILAIATAWFLGPGSFSFFGAGGVFGSGGLGLLSGTTASFASTVAAGFASGGIQGGNIQSALQGAFSAALFFGVGQFVPGDAGSFGKVVAHAAAGCASSAAAGGSCRAGAISAGFAEFAGSRLGNWGDAGNFVKHVAIAAAGAKLAGGKAENAAVTAAFGYLFNHGMAAAAAAARTSVAATTTTCTPCGGKQGTPLDYETGVPPQVAVGPKLPDIGGFIMDVGKIAAMFTPIAIADRLAGIVLSKPPSDAHDPNGSKAPGKPGETEGFSDPRTGERWVKNPNGRGNGWLDADGKVWVPSGQGSEAHGGPHWDVQNPRKPDDYTNIYPGGKRR